MWRIVLLVLLAGASLISPASAQAPASPRSRDEWIRLKDNGFALPDGAKAFDRLVEMNGLLASTDPVLRDDVAYTAAERWVLRERRLTADEVRGLRDLWLSNLEDGLGTAGVYDLLTAMGLSTGLSVCRIFGP